MNRDDEAGLAIAKKLRQQGKPTLARSGVPPVEILDLPAFTMATVLLEAGNFDAVEEIAVGLVQRYPGHPEGLYLLGCLALWGHDDTSAAAECFAASVASRPAFAEGWYNLGYSLQRAAGREIEARAAYEKALALAPRLAGAWVNLGNCKLAAGDVTGALDCYAKAKDGDAGNALARYNRSIAYLLTGDHAAGWRDYEARWETPLFRARVRVPDLPMWDGKPLNGRQLLVVAEQGIGDTIMCAGYMDDPRIDGADWLVQPELIDLLAGDGPNREPWPEADCWVGTMSLMHYLGQPTAPRRPYLTPWPQKGGLIRRVGYTYAGSPDYENNRRRSIDKTLWGDLFATPGIEWVSLQYGDGFHPASWSDTSDLVDTLDLVISVDTAVAHLAGAKGCPVWILLPSWPDYRWGLETDRSVWYSSAELIRQARDGDWPEVLARVKQRLETWREER